MRELHTFELEVVSGAGRSPCAPPPCPPPPCPRKKKGNNGYGNGGFDGSPNGKQDYTR